VTSDELDAALAALRAGGVVAAATETWFGLLAEARDGAAIDRVFSLKGRAAEKGVAVLLPDRNAWTTLVERVPTLAWGLADRFWPGPLTIALPARRSLDNRLLVDGTIGARWGSPSDASRIAQAFGAPLTATSANATGTPPLATSDEVAVAFGAARDRGDLLIVSGRAPGGEPSTVIAVHGERAVVVREGAVPSSAIVAALPAGALLNF
jgi:L-threonylcarbamoyladenylate synthase